MSFSSVAALYLTDVLGVISIIDVFEQEHGRQVFLILLGKSAIWCELCSVLIGTEYSIPDRQIGVVVIMHVQLVMDRMEFGSLD